MEAVSLSNSSVAASAAASSNSARTPISAVTADLSAASAVSATSAFSQNREVFSALTSTVLDTSGKYSYDERLQAYSSLFEMGVKGQLRGMDGDNRNLYDRATIESDIGRKAAQVQQKDFDTVTAAVARGEFAGTVKLKFVAELSDSDQRTHFAVTENGFDLAGNRQYADFDSYRNQLVANASQKDSDGFEQLLKILNSASAGSSWSAQVLSLITSDNFAASNSSGTNPAGQTSVKSKMPLSYQPGDIFARVA